MKYTHDELAKTIDHSLLHPTMTDQELEDGCRLEAEYGVASVCIWVKTSTGFGFVKLPGGGYGYQGATDRDLALMPSSVSDRVQVKAAGGVRDLDSLVRVMDLGASRCGATATAAILDEYRRREAAEASDGD